MKKKCSVLCLAVVLVLITILSPCSVKAETMADRVKSTVEINKFYSFQKEYNQRQYYEITLTRSGYLNFDFSYGREKENALGLGLEIVVFDQKGTIKDSQLVDINDNARIELTDGKYIIEISQNIYGAGTYNGYFYLTFKERVEDYLQLNITLKKGESIQLGAIVTPTNDSTYTWKSSNSKIATVSKKGLVKAKKKGKTTIKVKASVGYFSELVSTIVVNVIDK